MTLDKNRLPLNLLEALQEGEAIHAKHTAAMRVAQEESYKKELASLTAVKTQLEEAAATWIRDELPALVKEHTANGTRAFILDGLNADGVMEFRKIALQRLGFIIRSEYHAEYEQSDGWGTIPAHWTYMVSW